MYRVFEFTEGFITLSLPWFRSSDQALIIRVGVWGLLNYNHSKEAPNSIANSLGSYSTHTSHLGFRSEGWKC